MNEIVITVKVSSTIISETTNTTLTQIIGCTTAMNYGGGYRSSSVIKEFPQPFTGRPVVTCSLEEYGSNNSISVMVAPLPSDFLTKCFAQWRTITSDGSRSRSAGYIAVGRWN